LFRVWIWLVMASVVGITGMPRSASAETLERIAPAVPAETAETAEARQVAERLLTRWAPVYVQHVADGDHGADRPTRIDFDGDWDATNNWDHQEEHGTALPPAAYGAAILTESHAYLTYTLYYPRDWSRLACLPLVCHDNDLETITVVVERDGGDGRLAEIRTKAHHSISETTGAQVARAADDRPLLWVEPEGHGISVCTAGDPACTPQDGRLVYVPGAAPSAPPDEARGQQVTYELLSLRETLWARRHVQNDRLWTRGERGPLYYAGRMAGRIGDQMGAAMASSRFMGGVTPPWALAGRGGARGDWFLDPAGTSDYVYNPFLDDLRAECTGPLCLPQPPEPTTWTKNFSSGAIWLACSLAVGALHGRRRRSATAAR